MRSNFSKVISIAVLVFLVSCGGGEGGSSSTSSGSSLVSVTVGGSGQTASIKVEKNTLFAQARLLFKKLLKPEEAIAAIPCTVNQITFTISAPDMNTITSAVPVSGQSSITQIFTVPDGNDRTFLIEAMSLAGKCVYRGSTLASLTGTAVTLDIPMSSAARVGSLWTWGYNNRGQIGDGTTITRPAPYQVSGMNDVVSAAVGQSHTVILKSDGIWGWGSNNAGQLGNGLTAGSQFTPVQAIGGLSNIVLVAAGTIHTLAIQKDGTLWAWGSNINGQLGDGTQTNRLAPVQVGGISNVAAVSGGQYHTLALKSDGTVWAWGDNANGQLGDGTTVQKLAPVQVAGLTNVILISAGSGYSMALKSDGTVWAWGVNSVGQLGDGTQTTRLTPVQVSNIAGVTDIAASVTHSLALKSDGTVWAWGSNGTGGKLGDGNINTYAYTPVQVVNLTEVSAIAIGQWNSYGLKSDGTLWAWGANLNGGLGNNGATGDSPVPVQSSISGVFYISRGGMGLHIAVLN